MVDCCVVVVFGCNGTDWGLAWAGSSRVEWGKDDYFFPEWWTLAPVMMFPRRGGKLSSTAVLDLDDDTY